ncbi:hypothetical protein [Serratia odorifera]|jgi:hypothetical protein|uniref:Uncharacterized protein n=2 Tax=Serratia odorifera TaxID=618 RepID=D4E4P2_SEROD|nr:hypothetical protein [Serratia odorifera]EFE95088.1 hypothetical protein HMPREF0758_3142 [Serratia odorifera DSM 4582]MBJ2064553.1 hypothetical protein [Serratia odorifera]PNK89953.1 hypothetical protein CEQ31_009635 [Serratia odorifera]RII70462.1 hypothetical protein DX901_16685 [Serratia odorifera]VDZ61506.1 Uncharacterised protein [Serratia odorifera]
MTLPIQSEKQSRQTPVTEDIPLLRLSWLLEKLGYVLMFSVVIAALAGVFADGILSDTRQQNVNGTLTVDYQRFARQGAQSQWRVKIKDDGDGPLTLMVSDSLTASYLIENIQPQSVQVTQRGNEILFSVPDDDRQQWHTFNLTLRAQDWGRFSASLADGETPPIVIHQWIYP